MTQEEKQLLIQDICARLPYGLKFDAGTVNPIHTLQTIYTDAETYAVEFMDESGFSFEFDDIKPYLRPMSSMTEEEEKFYNQFFSWYEQPLKDIVILIEWLNKHMFDYRGLIEKGFALESPEGMYDENC